MTAFYGHTEQLAKAGLLEYPLNLPNCLLISGKRGIGKETVAEWLAARAGADKWDRLTRTMTASGAEDVLKFSEGASIGKSKVALARLFGTATHWQTYNKLLKLAEEPPPNFHLIFLSNTHDIPATLESRAFHVRLNALSDEDLCKVLMEKLEWSPEKAQAVLPFAAGSVETARLYSGALDHRDKILVYLQAVATRDTGLGNAAATGFVSTHIELIGRWCAEAITGQWKIFNPAEMNAEVLKLAADHDRVFRFYEAIRQPGRAWIVARAALLVT